MKHLYLTLALSCGIFGAASAQSFYPTGINGCIARWDFSSTTSAPTAVNDVSGNGNNGQAFNLQAATGFRPGANRAMRFNGTSSYAKVLYAPMLQTSAVTMIGMVNFTDFYSGPCQVTQLLSKGTHYEAGTYGFCVQDNKFDNDCNTYSPSYMQFLPTAASSQYQTSATLGNFVQKNAWYFVAVTYDGAEVREYMVKMDSMIMGSVGTPIFSKSGLNDPIGIGNQPITIGSLLGNNFWFNGVMDEMVLFNRALTQSEVNGVYEYLWKDGRLNVAETQPALGETVFCNNGVLNVKLAQSGSYSVKVMNLAGQQVAAISSQSGASRIDLSAQPDGILTYQIVTDAGNSAAGKFFKK